MRRRDKKRRGTFEREVVRCEKFGYRDFFYYTEWKKKKKKLIEILIVI